MKSTVELRTQDFMVRVERELQSAREKFPDSICSMTALTEEVGELAKACMEEPMENVINEAVQVAVMAVRVATEGDRTINPVRWKRGLKDESELFPEFD